MLDPLEEAKIARKRDVDILCLEKMRGGIDYTAMTTVFDSSGFSPNAIIAYQIAGVVPIGFTVPDMNGNFVVVSLAQLLALNTGMVDLHYLANVNSNIHKNAIDLLTTVEEVEEYNITTGWPIVPWVI